MLVLSIIIYTVFSTHDFVFNFNVDVANIEFYYFYDCTVILSITLTIYVHRSKVDLGYSSLYSKPLNFSNLALGLAPGDCRPSLLRRGQRENNDLTRERPS